MTSPRRSWDADADQREPPNPLRGLVELLLDVLLDEIPSALGAQLTVRTQKAADALAEPCRSPSAENRSRRADR